MLLLTINIFKFFKCAKNLTKTNSKFSWIQYKIEIYKYRLTYIVSFCQMKIYLNIQMEEHNLQLINILLPFLFFLIIIKSLKKNYFTN